MTLTVDTITLIQLATASVTLVTAAAAFLQSNRNGRKIQEVHLSVNSRLDELVSSTKSASYAAGVKHGEDNPRVPSWTELGAK